MFALAGEPEHAAGAVASPGPVHPDGGSHLSPDLQAALAQRGIAPELFRRKRKDDDAELQAGRKALDELSEGNALRDYVAPVAVMAAGIALMFGQALVWNERPAGSAAQAVVTVATRAVLSVGLMLGGIWLAVAVMEVTLIGSFVGNLLKLCAVALGPAAVYDILRFTVGGQLNGPAAGAFASIALYALLFFLLMRMDARDTAVCTMVTFILVAGANYAAFRIEGMRQGSEI